MHCVGQLLENRRCTQRDISEASVQMIFGFSANHGLLGSNPRLKKSLSRRSWSPRKDVCHRSGDDEAERHGRRAYAQDAGSYGLAGKNFSAGSNVAYDGLPK